MVVTKIDPRVYTYYLSADKNDPEYTSCLWAQFVFDCSTGLLNINSDAGDYSYRWGYNEHEDFMHLMSRIHKDYLLSKISDRTVFCLQESIQETVKSIELDGFECYGIESEEDWQGIKRDLLNMDVCSEESYLHEVESIVPDIDWESIYVEKDYPYGAKVVCDLFETYLLPMLKEEFGG